MINMAMMHLDKAAWAEPKDLEIFLEAFLIFLKSSLVEVLEILLVNEGSQEEVT